MKIGMVFPQTEYGNDPAAIRDYAQTAEELGYTHILAYEHVLGANPDRPGWSGPYTYQTPFHEPFVLFSYMAAITRQIEFTTGILILPQRQTALAAKQAASLDVISGGRFRMGIGIGWNKVEYEALNQDFHTRGKRIEEQVELMRQLWDQPLVNFSGDWHTIPDAGINPLPVQRPIPIWFGGQADVVLRRIARLGDGWMANSQSPEDARPLIEALAQYIAEAGRRRDEIGIEARIKYGDGDLDRIGELVNGWESVGATHISFNTMGCGFGSPGEHLDALQKLAGSLLG